MSETQEQIEAREAEEAKTEEAAGEGGEGNEEGEGEGGEGIEDKEQKIKDLEEELAKEKDKAKNFQGLKEKEKVKRKKVGERLEDLENQVTKERENRQALQNSIMGDAKENSLEQLAGEDKDLRDKLEQRVKDAEDYLGAPEDSKELTERYEKAYGFIKGEQRRVSPIHAMSTVTGSQNETRQGEKKYPDTAEGQKMIEDKFPEHAAAEKRLKEAKKA